MGAPEQPVHHHAGQRAEHRARLRRPEGRADRRDHLRRPHQRPRAADPRDHRPRRGGLRRPDARRRGDLRRRGRRGPAALRPDVDAPVHVLPGGRVRGALARTSSVPPTTGRSSRTSTGSSATRRTATSCGRATATTCAPLLWLMQLKNGEVTGRRDAGRHPPDRGGAQPRRRRDHAERPGQAADHRRRALAAGDRASASAPRPVRRPARGDLGGAPPRLRRPPRRLAAHVAAPRGPTVRSLADIQLRWAPSMSLSRRAALQRRQARARPTGVAWRCGNRQRPGWS